MISNAGPQTESISLEYDLTHPPEKVWRALTEPTLLAEWLLPSIGFKPRPGTVFSFKAPAQPEWDGTVNCRVLEMVEHRKLSWRWVVGEIDTVVTFTLTPSASGTHLGIVQSGFRPDQKRNIGGARYGWKMMSDKLVELLTRE
jgi:uncharacterized protein YndB with AHSA1/START domain